MLQLLRSTVESCFTLSGMVSQGMYFRWGLGLSVLKYAVEAAVIGRWTGRFYSPYDFLSPLLSHRASYLDGAPTWMGMSLVLWTLPFMWIAVAMSIRRYRDAGYSPWFGLVMLIPTVNYLGMFALCLLPKMKATSAEEAERQRELLEVWQAPQVDSEPPLMVAESGVGVVAAMMGAAAGAMYAGVSTVLSVYVLGSYGAALFFGTPLVAGAVSAFLFNRPDVRGVGATILHSLAMIVFSCCGLLMIGFEGLICIVMALPILIPIALMGALIGRSISIESNRPRRESQGMLWCLGGLPVVAAVESVLVLNPTLAVSTTVEIQAPPKVVWNQVIAFPEITDEPEWFFRAGIAAPIRAHIDGSGVGAIRYCQFTTGTFVEPITVWEPNRRLAFDVTEQPDPMFELTPYQHIHPPHLDGSFRSTRGEFQLEHLPNGGTRLTGTTWYLLDMHPQSYWTLWSDELVHRIHLRVLQHIRDVAERA